MFKSVVPSTRLFKSELSHTCTLVVDFGDLITKIYQSRSMQTRPGQQAAKKHGTVSAGLMRQYGTHPEKTRKLLLAVARLRAGRGFRAGLQADSQTPGSPFSLRRRRRGVTPTASLDTGTCRQPASMVFNQNWPAWGLHGNHAVAAGSRYGCRPVEEEVARNRTGAVFSQSSGQSWVAAWRPLPLKFCIRSYQNLPYSKF